MESPNGGGNSVSPRRRVVGQTQGRRGELGAAWRGEHRPGNNQTSGPSTLRWTTAALEHVETALQGALIALDVLEHVHRQNGIDVFVACDGLDGAIVVEVELRNAHVGKPAELALQLAQMAVGHVGREQTFAVEQE